MAWFASDAVEFFRELELNNNKEWFAANKTRYQRSVQVPMETFAAEMISRVKHLDPEVATDPKKAVFRIYRDIRFSKDKTPYKTNAGMWISSGHAHVHAKPGLYFHIDARHMGIASGLYSLEPPQLRAVRANIAANIDRFEALLKDPRFVKAFGTIRGEANKIAPSEFKEAATKQPLLLNKQFYYWAEFDAEEALRDDLPDILMDRLDAARSMNEFLSSAL
jgi:uncharacterized protein (TIGR02453 family)